MLWVEGRAKGFFWRGGGGGFIKGLRKGGNGELWKIESSKKKNDVWIVM